MTIFKKNRGFARYCADTSAHLSDLCQMNEELKEKTERILDRRAKFAQVVEKIKRV